MNEPHLIKCDQCARMGKMVYLGSISSQGDFIFRNNAATYSAIMKADFTLIHDCGFTIEINSGIVTTTLSPSMNE